MTKTNNMASVTFLMDNKEGHIIPSFKLARSLQQRAHRVTYLSIVDNEQMVKDQGFGFRPIFRDIYAPGFNRQNKWQGDDDAFNTQKRREHLQRLMEGELNGLFEPGKTDLLIISSVLCLEALLIYFKYNVKPVVLTTFLRDAGSSFKKECLDAFMDLPGDTGIDIINHIEQCGVQFNSMLSLLEPADKFYELVLCPAELDMGNLLKGDNVFHIGPSVLTERKIGDKLDVARLAKGKKLVYASLGSHSIIYGEACRVFFSTMIEVMKRPAMKNFHLVLSVGQEIDISGLGKLPPNITIVRWVSQVDVLKVASLVITHGGLGTIKECIFYGVPMIVFPMKLDQVRNAVLVEYHSLGMAAKIEEISTEGLLAGISYVLEESIIQTNIKNMQRIFHEKEAANEGVEIVERLVKEQHAAPAHELINQ